MLKNNHRVVLLQNQNQLLFAHATKSQTANVIYRFLPNEHNHVFYSFYAFVLANTILIDHPIQHLQLKNNEIIIVFSSAEKLKLKQLKKEWKELKTTGLKFNSIRVKCFESPFFNLSLTDQTINFEQQLLKPLPPFRRVNLINLSTFTKDEEVFHKLVVKIAVDQQFIQNDHRELNKNLKFFYFSDKIGPGLPFWLPNGVIVKNLIRDYLHSLETKAGFVFVESPLLGSEKIYQTSEHLKHYKNFMFPMLKRKNEVLYLRPMTCPHHCLIYQSEPRSYLNLPLRLSENAYLFRQEASGALIGLERVRQMQLKDSHLFLTTEQAVIEAEIKQCFQMTKTALKALGIKIKSIYLSLNDEKFTTKFIHAPQLWSKTTKILQNVLKSLEVDFKLMIGEAAFYGPKIDFQIDTALGHNITISTIQLDFSLPQKFNLTYRTASQSGAKHQTPILIHHGLIGTYERLFTILMEQNNGWLPFWLSPMQILILPLDNDVTVQNYAQKIQELLQQYQFRSQIADTQKKLGENLKTSWLQKIPVRIFIGKEELAKRKITFQMYTDSQKKQTQDPFAFIDLCLNLIRNKK